jgi:hypothetical protein
MCSATKDRKKKVITPKYFIRQQPVSSNLLAVKVFFSLILAISLSFAYFYFENIYVLQERNNNIPPINNVPVDKKGNKSAQNLKVSSNKSYMPWATYSNSSLNLVLRYPAIWNVGDCTENFLLLDPEKSPDCSNPSISPIHIYTGEKPIDEIKFLEEMQKEFEITPVEVKYKSMIPLNKYLVENIRDKKPQFAFLAYRVADNNGVFSVYVYDLAYEESVEMMISTLYFLK